MGPARRILGAGHPLAPRELGDLRSRDALGGVEVELVESLHLGEPSGAQALLDGRLGAGGDLDGEGFVQVVLVRPVLLTCLTGEVLEGSGQARHLELACLRADDLGDDGDAAHWAPPSQRS
jgi:hypothetical protein